MPPVKNKKVITQKTCKLLLYIIQHSGSAKLELRTWVADSQGSQEELKQRPPSQHRPISAAVAPLPPPPNTPVRPFSPLGEQAPRSAMFARVVNIVSLSISHCYRI